MLRLAFAQLRFRAGRSVVLVVVLVATVACFALVGASARTEQVTVHGTLEADSRAAYDLLVRPAGSVSAAEQRGNLVSSTAMSSIDGGITLKQWHEIEQIPGVYAAAPVAVVGYDYLQYDVAVHVPSPAAGQSQVLYRLAPQFVSENGLTKIPADDEYVYTTTSPLAAPLDQPDPQVPLRDGSMLAICQAGRDPASTSEIVPACGSTNRQDAWNTPSAANPHATGSQLPTGTQDIAWYFPFLVEAIDPAQEAKLDGLDHAVTSGDYFSESAGPVSYTATKPDAQSRKVGGCAWSLRPAAADPGCGVAVPVDERPGAGRRCQPDAGGFAGQRVPDAAVGGGHGRQGRHRRRARHGAARPGPGGQGGHRDRDRAAGLQPAAGPAGRQGPGQQHRGHDSAC